MMENPSDVDPVTSMSFGERLADLDEVERNIIQMMQSAGQCLTELGKDKTPARQAENQASEFLKRIQIIEKTLMEQINYLSEVGVGAAHEGSAYMSVRSRQSAEERASYIYEKLSSYRNKLNMKNV